MRVLPKILIEGWIFVLGHKCVSCNVADDILKMHFLLGDLRQIHKGQLGTWNFTLSPWSLKSLSMIPWIVILSRVLLHNFMHLSIIVRLSLLSCALDIKVLYTRVSVEGEIASTVHPRASSAVGSKTGRKRESSGRQLTFRGLIRLLIRIQIVHINTWRWRQVCFTGTVPKASTVPRSLYAKSNQKFFI